MLGVIIGVGSVIAMIGIGQGTKQKSLASLQLMGSNRISVMPNFRRGQGGGAADSASLKNADVDNIREQVPLVEYITGQAQTNATVKFGNSNQRTQVIGAEPQVRFIMNSTKMLAGDWYSDDDNTLMNKVCVLGYQVYDQLYSGQNAVGTYLKINNENYTVVGVVDYKGGSGFQNPDNQVMIPLKTAQNRMMGARERLDNIAIQATRTDLMPLTQSMVEGVLAKTRKSATGEQLFRVFNQADSLAQIETQSQLMTWLLGGIASVSLLVGGIGIMNIMLVSVTERTREIGLRKALGANSASIRNQFLLEAVVICLLGGGLGIFLGIVATQVVARALQLPPVVDLTSVVLAFSFSSVIGLSFGLYPAMRASALLPIEALKYE